MWKVTIKGLLAHKLRLALTALAIVIGVTFIAGTFVLTDTLNQTFDSLFGSIYQKVDFQVRGVAELGSGGFATRNPIPETIVPSLRAIPGVQVAEGTVTGYAQFVDKEGKAITTGGAPTLGVSFDPDPRLSSLHVDQGKPPTTPDQVVMDRATAQKYGFVVGQRVEILFRAHADLHHQWDRQVRNRGQSGRRHLGGLRDPHGAAGARLRGDLQRHQRRDEPRSGQGGSGAPDPTRPPPGVEVVTGQTVVDEATSAVGRALGIFNTALLVFGFIALFVGGFTILNTFSIIVGQRTRELALLRIVGASRRQVFRSVLGEAAIVGLLSSLIGLGLGVLAAKGLEALLKAFGVSLPSGPLVFELRTVVVCFAVGTGVTVVAAIGPARRAVRIAPVAAIAERQGEGELSLRRRFIWGSALALIGAAVLGVGLAQPSIALVGLGALLLFVGVAFLAPAVARPMSSVIGRPLERLFGMSGRLGRENSMRSPQRTAQTASALMIGLALVSAIAVFGASLSRSVTSSVDEAVRADLILSPPSGALAGFSNEVAPTAAAVPGVTASSTVYQGPFKFKTSVTMLTAVSTEDLAQTVNVSMTQGSTDALSAGELLVDTTVAKDNNLVVGDTVPVKFAKTGDTRMRVGGIYQVNSLIGSYVVGDAFFLSHFDNVLPVAVLLKTDGSPGVEHLVEMALAPYPNVKIQTPPNSSRRSSSR